MTVSLPRLLKHRGLNVRTDSRGPEWCCKKATVLLKSHTPIKKILDQIGYPQVVEIYGILVLIGYESNLILIHSMACSI